MPLQQRVIEPVNVTRSTLPLPAGDIKPLIKSIAAATGQGLAANAAGAANINIVNELECVTNGTLSNLIRQLSSLSRQAEELLTGVFDDASKLLTRTAGLQQRMDVLAAKIDTLEQPSDAPIILRDPTNQQETFSSDMSYNQQILSKQQMPSSISELYQTCDKPPPLYKLDPYRDDGKDGLKFYTDPTYFFELWKKDMMKETKKAQLLNQPQQQQQLRQQQHLNQATRTLQHQRRLSQHSPQQIQQQQYLAGKARQQVVSINGSYTSSTTYVSSVDSNQDMYGQSKNQLGNQVHRGSIDADKTTEAMTRYMQQTTINDDRLPMYQPQQSAQIQKQPQVGQIHHHHQQQQLAQVETLQKHPQQQPLAMQSQPPNQTNQTTQQYHQTPYVTGTQQLPPQQQMMATPPPPPALSPLPPPSSPPPPPPPPAPPAPSQTVSQPPSIIQPPTAAQLQQKQQQLRKIEPVQRDPRSDLLAAIKQGITLRRVEDSKRRVEAEKQQSMGNDVASILARRVAMQVSDSDDNGEDEEDNDWDDSSNR